MKAGGILRFASGSAGPLGATGREVLNSGEVGV